MPQPLPGWISRTTPDGYEFIARQGDYRTILVKTPEGVVFEMNLWSVVAGPLPYSPFVLPGWVELTFPPYLVRQAIEDHALANGAVVDNFRADDYRLDFAGLFADSAQTTFLSEVPCGIKF